MSHTLSNNGFTFIQNHEGCRLVAYYDSANVITIGYGHTNMSPSANQYPVSPGLTITQSQADTMFELDLGPYEDAVNNYVTVDITQNQFDALVSFTYNVGIGNFKSSDVLEKLNNNDITGAADCFGEWVHSAGKVVPGLVTRRADEKQLFLEGYSSGSNSGSNSNASTYVVQSGDSLSGIAVEFDTTVANLEAWNNISDPNKIQIGQTLYVKKPSGSGSTGTKTYVVQSGDTLSGIAVEFDTTVANLEAWNNISDPNKIQIGQTLYVEKPSGSGSTGTKTYVVQSGDTLSGIAVKFDTTVANLEAWNNISDPNKIQVGQTLYVEKPSGSGSTGTKTYVVQSGDTLSGIAVKFDTTVANLEAWNNISDPNKIQVGQTLYVEKPSGSGSTGTKTYVVQSGDTLSGIAVKFDTTVANLEAWNNISDPNKIQVGQTLVVSN